MVHEILVTTLCPDNLDLTLSNLEGWARTLFGFEVKMFCTMSFFYVLQMTSGDCLLPITYQEVEVKTEITKIGAVSLQSC